jgi:hypothetical protein
MFARSIKRAALSHRSGVSLLEVLMSIGIVGIGLIGVAALIPVAHEYAMKAVIRDRAAELGQRAFREFKLRGFDQPGTLSNPFWFHPMAGSPWGIFYTLAPPPPPNLPPPNFEPERLVVQSYCFDPVHIASRLSAGSALPLVAQFPENSGAFYVPRVTALSSRLEKLYPAAFPNVRLTALSSSLAAGNKNLWPIIQPWQAETICTLREDLIYQAPEDRNQSSFQEFRSVDHDGRPATPDARNVRLNEGNFSWMATLVPDVELRYDLLGTPFAYRRTDNYLLSIAIFHRRVVNDSLKPVQEIIAPVGPPGIGASLTMAPMGATSKELHLAPTTYNADQGATFGELRPGVWIIVGQNFAGVHTLKWMKVTSQAQETPPDSGSYLLTVTGSDLNFFMMSSTGTPSPIPTYVIYVRDVVHVYEKTIRLQTSSAYEY